MNSQKERKGKENKIKGLTYKPSANESTLKRTVAPADVFAALSELELDSFRTRLEAELEAYTDIKAGKRKAKKPEEEDAAASAGASAGRDGDDDVEMNDNPAKRVKRDSEGKVGGDDGDETQDEEEVEEEHEHEHEHEHEDEEEDEEDDEEEDGEEGKGHEEDIDRVEDLDGSRRLVDPDDEESEDDDGPGSQLHNDLGLG